MLFGMDTGIIGGVLTLPNFQESVFAQLINLNGQDLLTTTFRDYGLADLDDVPFANLQANIGMLGPPEAQTRLLT